MASRPAAVGLALECSQGQHHLCQTVGCRCGCHVPARDLLQRTEVPPVDEPPITTNVSGGKVCPQCSKTWSATDKYCRRDGHELVAGIFCTRCQAVAIPGDAFCWSCGNQYG